MITPLYGLSRGGERDKISAPVQHRRTEPTLTNSPSVIRDVELEHRFADRTVLVLPSRAGLVHVLGGDVDLTIELGEPTEVAARETGDGICLVGARGRGR